jgi:hypothetical protein
MKKKSIAEKYRDDLVAAIKRSTVTGNDLVVSDLHSAIEAASVKMGSDDEPGLFTFKDGSTLDVVDLSITPAKKKRKAAAR